jgi:VWFA-related protein
VTVRDENGRLVPDLPVDAFTVLEDGEPQAITQYAHERVPVGLGLLLDISDSMFGQRIKDARAAVERFLLELLSADDSLFVMTFNHEPHVLIPWTPPAETAAVRAGLDMLRPFGGTAVYDAVLHALTIMDHRPRDRAQRRGAELAVRARLLVATSRRREVPQHPRESESGRISGALTERVHLRADAKERPLAHRHQRSLSRGIRVRRDHRRKEKGELFLENRISLFSFLLFSLFGGGCR